MTHDEREHEMDHVPPGRLEIDALLDGESVDKESLRVALGDEGARDYLIDLLLLRQLTHELGPSRYVAPHVPHSPFARGVRWLAAILVLTVGAGGGYLYGVRSHPPAPPQTSSSFEVVVDTTEAPPAPEPTQTIRFEPGVNWTSRPGSN